MGDDYRYMDEKVAREHIIRDLQSARYFAKLNPRNEDPSSPESPWFYWRRAARWKEDLGIEVADE